MSDEKNDDSSGADASNWRTPPFHHWAFHNVSDILPVAEIECAPEGASSLLETPQSFDDFKLELPDGSALDLNGFLKATSTDGLVILHDGRIVFEFYDGGTTAQTPHILMSVTKAMTGLLAGLLQRNGDLDIDAPVSTYVPEIADTGYRGATIRHLLDMRTGVTMDEGRYDAVISSQDETNPKRPSLHTLLETSTAPQTHGGPFSYISANTDLLGWAIERATGRPFADVFSELLWRPMGAEDKAYIVVDHQGSPWCSGGLCVTPRDFARVGDLLVNDGRRVSVDVVPKAWIDDLYEGGDREAWKTGAWGAAFAGISRDMSYRAGWYSVPDAPKHLFAMGTHGQNLFIDRANQLVIAKVSSQTRLDYQAIMLTHRAFPELSRCALKGSS